MPRRRHTRTIYRWSLPLLIIVSGWCAPFTYAQSGGIEVFAGGTLFDKGFRFSQSHLYERRGNLYRGSNRVSNSQDLLFEEHLFVTGIDYGALPDLTLSALIPVVYNHMRIRTPTGTSKTSASGLGDIAALAKYRVWKTDWARSTFNWAIIAGIEAPSGETDEYDNGMRLPPLMQPGSGSWDPIAATGVTLSLNRLRFDGLFLYKANTEGTQSYDDGDFFVMDVDAAYRFLHTKYPGPTASAKIGIQFRHQGVAKQNKRKVANTGTNQIIVHPGLTLHPKPGLDLSIAVEVPVYRDVRGTQLVRDIRTVLAFGIRF